MFFCEKENEPLYVNNILVCAGFELESLLPN